jgi:hypothetical protein
VYVLKYCKGTPGAPFGANGLFDLVNIEPSMRKRRLEVQKFLDSDEQIISLASFPMMGAVQYGPFTKPPYATGGPVATSVFTPDEIIHPHFRFSYGLYYAKLMSLAHLLQIFVRDADPK